MTANSDDLRYLVVLSVDPLFFDGDESIERACEMVNEYLWEGDGVNSIVASVRPLSELFSC
jgi:hypothetical protein